MFKRSYEKQLSARAEPGTRRPENGNMDQSRGLHSDSGGSTENQPAESPKYQKSKPAPEFLSLARCAGCYNHRKSSKFRWGYDSESSTSEESDGGWDSEPESSCSSSSSEEVLDEMPEEPATEESSAVSGDAAGGRDGDGQAGETSSQSQEDEKRTKRAILRAPLVKSFSLPDSLAHHLTPESQLPRPPRVVSVLNLQVLQPKPNSDTFYALHEGKGGGISGPPPPQPFQQWRWQQQGLPGQWRSKTTSQQHLYQPQQLPHLHQQPPLQLSQQYGFFSPLAAQGQRFPPPPPPPPPLHSLPVLPPPATLPAPQTHLHALAPQSCWYCYRTHFPHACLSQQSSGRLPR